jgi:hypothetical protein
MRAIWSLIVLALGAPLGGCFSLTAQKPVPDWAMATQAQSVEQPRARVSRAPAQRRVAEERTFSVVMPIVTDNVAMPIGDRPVARSSPQPAGAAPTNFSAEWYAQEKAADEQLRRRMNICNGC